MHRELSLCDLQIVRVGETGFEPATARPPAGCATRLRHSPWSVESTTVPSGRDANMCSCQMSFSGGAETVAHTSRSQSSPGAAGIDSSATTSAESAARRTSSATMPPTASATSTRHADASRCSLWSGWDTYSLTSPPTHASTAVRPMRSCSSSTICATSDSTSAERSPIAAGPAFSRRSRSARWYAPTVTVAGRLNASGR
jgi:hypothetical protein